MTNKHVLKARIAALEAELALEEIKGGPGSGNWGHAGRPGKKGGSMPRSQAMSRTSGKDWKQRQAAARGDKGEPGKKDKGSALATAQARRDKAAARLEELKERGYDPKLMGPDTLDWWEKRGPQNDFEKKLHDLALDVIAAKKEMVAASKEVNEAKIAGMKKPASGGPPAGDEAVANREKAIDWMAEGVQRSPWKGPHSTEVTSEKLISMLEATEKSRANAKIAIVDSVSEKSGLDSETVNQMVKNWANTSGDSNIESLKMQVAAARAMGREPDKYVADKLKALQSNATGQYDRFSDDQYDAFVKAMYVHTQEEFASAGFKPTDTLRLYRGVNEVFQGTGTQHGDEVVLQQSAMTSWSLASPMAASFAYGSLENGSGLLTMDVPVSSIIGSCKTGVGCLTEAELVIADTGGHRALVQDKYRAREQGEIKHG